MSREFDDDFEDIEVKKSPARSLELESDPEEAFSSEATRRIERADRRRRNKKKKKSHTALWLILLMILAIGGVVGAKYYANMNGMSINDIRQMIPFLKQEQPVETEPATDPVVTEAATEAETETEVALAENTNAEVVDLVKSYYAARLAGDSEGLAKIVADGVEIDAEALNSEKEFVENYNDITSYIAAGMEEGEYAVYVSYNQKFKDIETAAPGLQPCYVSTAVDGTMRLSFFDDWDEATKQYMNQVSGSKAVKALVKKVGDDFTAAKNADESLKNFLGALSGETQSAETEAAETDAQQSETTAAESTAAETTAASGEITFKEVDDIQYTTTQVRCRKVPSLEETDDYTMLEAGAWVHVVGVSDNWMKVITGDGYSGYVYSEYLTPDKPETQEG